MKTQKGNKRISLTISDEVLSASAKLSKTQFATSRAEVLRRALALGLHQLQEGTSA